MIKSLQNLLRN